jgi:hypothetical protein
MCWVLRNLVSVDEIRKYMVSDVVIVPVLVSLSHGATTTSDTAQIQATELPATMVTSDVSVCDAIESLVHALTPTPPSSSKSSEATLRAIHTLPLLHVPTPARHGPSPCVGLPLPR